MLLQLAVCVVDYRADRINQNFEKLDFFKFHKAKYAAICIQRLSQFHTRLRRRWNDITIFLAKEKRLNFYVYSCHNDRYVNIRLQ